MKTKKKGHPFHRGPIVHAKPNEDQKTGRHVRRGPIFHAKSSEGQKKTGHHVRSGPIFHAKLSIEHKIFTCSYYKRIMFISTPHLAPPGIVSRILG